MIVINLFFVITSLIAFIWNVFGTLPGIILLGMALSTEDKKKEKKYFKWSFICFGGIALLIALAILYAAISLIAAFMGISIAPQIPQ